MVFSRSHIRGRELLFNQPLSVRFGTELMNLIADSKWESFNFAVAWVRRSGMRHLRAGLESFLARGGSISAIVGIDLQNTTREGLEALLDLERFGAADTYVYYNENAASTFHPKIYLLRNKTDASLIVGSNNLTQAGLFTNVEAGLTVTSPVGDKIVQDVMIAFQSWSDPSTGLAKKLDAALLADLVLQGYVLDEGVLSSTRPMPSPSGSGVKTKKLFASRPVSAPAPASAAAAASGSRPGGVTIPAASGSVLLMRVRKASATGRPTQTQLPIRLYNTGFFGAASVVRSSHSGDLHQISRASARGSINTLKLEIPEMRTFSDPLLRIERIGSDLIYQAYDSTSAQGKQIMASLQAGRRTGATELTLPAQPSSSTWWRFI